MQFFQNQKNNVNKYLHKKLMEPGEITQNENVRAFKKKFV